MYPVVKATSKLTVGDLTLRDVGRTRVRIDAEVEGERLAASGVLKRLGIDDWDWDTDVVTTVRLEIGRMELNEIPVDTVIEVSRS